MAITTNRFYYADNLKVSTIVGTSQAQNTFSTTSFDPPTFSTIVTPDLVSPTIDTPTENSSDGSTVPRKDNNWRTLVIDANSIANKKLN